MTKVWISDDPVDGLCIENTSDDDHFIDVPQALIDTYLGAQETLEEAETALYRALEAHLAAQACAAECDIARQGLDPAIWKAVHLN